MITAELGRRADMDQVILVDETDSALGVADRDEVHRRPGLLHRAFSVFLFDAAGRMLLQRRAATKPRFGGLWSNACCSHPRPGEPTEAAAHRRLREELGVDAPLEHRFTFVYRAEDAAGGWVEHELDHVFVGRCDAVGTLDPAEIDEVCWVEVAELTERIADNPQAYTPWLRIALRRILTPTVPESMRDSDGREA